MNNSTTRTRTIALDPTFGSFTQFVFEELRITSLENVKKTLGTSDFFFVWQNSVILWKIFSNFVYVRKIFFKFPIYIYIKFQNCNNCFYMKRCLRLFISIFWISSDLAEYTYGWLQCFFVLKITWVKNMRSHMLLIV